MIADINDRYGFKLRFKGPLGVDNDPRRVVSQGIIDRSAVDDFFNHGYFHDHAHFFRDVELMPVVWTPVCDKIDIGFEDAVDEVYRLWMNVMTEMAEGDVGCQLSGGYDSRLIAATLARLNGSVKTLTFGWEGCDDIKIAKQVCEAIGAEHNAFILNSYNWFNHRIRGVYETAGAVNIFHIRFMNCLELQRQLFEINLSGFLGDVVIGNSYREGKHPISEAEGYTTRFRRFTNYGERLQANICEVRQPFINKELVDFCISLPDNVRSNLYPRLFTKYFPEIEDIPRQHSPIDNYSEWLSNGSGQIHDILFNKTKMYPAYIGEGAVQTWWDTKNVEMIGRAVTFELFLQQYYNGRYLPLESIVDFDMKQRQNDIDEYSRDHWVKNNMHESINDPTRPWHRERVKTIARLCEGKSILDLASADGAITEIIRKKNHPKRMTAFEGGIAAVENGVKLHPYIEWIQGMVEDLPFGTDEFNFVHAGEIIEHIRDVDKFVSNVSQICREGALITTPSIPVGDPQHISVFTPEALSELCLKYFDECEITIQPRTLFALCRHKKKRRRVKCAPTQVLENKTEPVSIVKPNIDPMKLVFVTPLLMSRVGGDVTQNNNILKILSGCGYSIDVLHIGDKCASCTGNVKCHEYGNTAALEVNFRQRWNNEGYAYVMARSIDMMLMASRIVPKDRLYGYVYGEYFSDKNITRAWNACHKVVVQGEGSLVEVKKLGLDVKKAVPIEVCIDTDSFQIPFVVGHIGKLFGYQDVRVALRAVSRIREEYPQVTLLVIGDEDRKGCLTDDNKNVVNILADTEWVTWIPKLKHNSMNTILASCDCVIARYKAMDGKKHSNNLVSTKALECALLGIPVIVNKSYNYEAVFGSEYGCYYESETEISSMIGDLVKEKIKRDQHKGKLPKCAEKFLMKNVAKKWKSLFPKIGAL